MSKSIFSALLRKVPRILVLILFIAYFGLVALKTPFDFSDPEFIDPRASQTQAQLVIENEPSDHFRTAAVSILLGLLLGNSLLRAGSAEHRRFAIAIFGSSVALIVSSFFGLSPLATQPILLLIALYGFFVAFKGFRG